MELRHGKVRLELPDGWLDQSTLLFVQPRAQVETVPAPAVTSNLSVRFAFGAGLSARELIEAEMSKLELVQPSLERIASGPFESPLGAGWHEHVRASLLDVAVEQLAVAWVVGDLGIIACCSCGARELKQERPRLEAMLRAIRLS